MVWWFIIFHAACGFQIGTVQQVPTYKLIGADPDIEGSGTLMPTVPSIPSVDGIHDEYREATAPKPLSRYTYYGCFESLTSLQASYITTAPDDLEASSSGESMDFINNWGDPNACIKFCRSPENFPVNSGGVVVTPEVVYVAVKKQLCTCFYDGNMQQFSEVEATRCNFRCGPFANPLCGGEEETMSDEGFSLKKQYYSVFREYDYVSMVSQGAYDPWRSIFFQVTVVKEQTINNADTYSRRDTVPERYCLHAVSTDTGQALFQYQIPTLPDMLYGLQFDLDDSRLVAIAISKVTGRVSDASEKWEFKLAIILIDAIKEAMPVVTYTTYEIRGVNFPQNSKKYLSFVGASGIFSKRGRDTLIFTQLASNEDGSRETKANDMLYAVNLGNPEEGYDDAGVVFHHQRTDMKVLQIMVNEAQGTVTGIGPGSANKNVFKIFGTIILDDAQMKTWQPAPTDYPGGKPGEAVLNTYELLYLIPAVCTSEHVDNWSIMGYRQIRANWDPEVDDPVGQGFFKININSGEIKRYCKPKSIDPECQTGVIKAEIAYAAIYNREPRIFLSLPAAQMISCTFTKDAMHIIIMFDLRTLRGSIPIDTNNDQLPDAIDSNCTACTMMTKGTFGCQLVLDPETVEIIGTGALCHWAQGGMSLVIMLSDDATVEVGSAMSLLPGVVYTEPPNEKPLRFSMPTAHQIQVTAPEGDLTPQIRISTDSTVTVVNKCSDLFIDAAATVGIGGTDRGTFEWSIIDGESIDSRTEGASQVDLEAVEAFGAELEKATMGNQKVLRIPSELMPTSSVFPIQLKVTSRWGTDYFAVKTFYVEKLSHDVPSVSVEKNVTGDFFTHQGLRLVASCIPSRCNTNEKMPAKTFRWRLVEGSPPVNNWDQISKSRQILLLSPYSLIKNSTYTFETQCQLEGVNSPSSARIQVTVSKSKIVPAGYFQRVHQHGKPLIMDGRDSYDPDEQFVTQPHMLFRYTYECFTRNREPCFAQKPPTSVLTDPQDCEFDETGVKLKVGGKSYQRPKFLMGQNGTGVQHRQDYCTLSRGVIAINTAQLPEPEDPGGGVDYVIRVTIESVDGRSATEDVTISLTSLWVPNVALSRDSFSYFPRLSECDRIPNNAIIQVAASVDTEGKTGTITYSWQVFTQLIVEERDQVTGNTITVFKHVPSGIDTTDTNKFTSNQGSLQIIADVFEMGFDYLLRCTVSVDVDGEGLSTGSADLIFKMAHYPPFSGYLKATSLNRSTLQPDPTEIFTNSVREVEVGGWKTTKDPIVYLFSTLSCANKDCTEMKKLRIGPTDTTRRRFLIGQSDDMWLPVGAPETFVLFIEVEIRAHCSVPIQRRIEVFSRPLTGASRDKAIERLTEGLATNTDPTSSVKVLLNVADQLGPDDVDIRSNLLDTALNSVTTEDAVFTEDTTKEGMLLLKGLSQSAEGSMDNDQVDKSIAYLEVLTSNQGWAVSVDLALTALQIVSEFLPFHEVNAISDDVGSGFLRAQSAAESPGSQSMDKNLLRSLSVSDFRGKRTEKRAEKNHALPLTGNTFVDDCWNDYCDMVDMYCLIVTQTSQHVFRCCMEPNTLTICNEPPCWFSGSICPGAALTSPAASRRRAQTREGETVREAESPQVQWFNEYLRVTKRTDITYDEAYDTISEHAKLYHDMQIRKNSLVRNLTRRLQQQNEEGANSAVNGMWKQDEVLVFEDLISLEKSEKPLLDLSQKLIKEKLNLQERESLEEAKREIICHTLAIKDPEDCALLRLVEQEKRKKLSEQKKYSDLRWSQVVTRLFSVRDTFCKGLLAGIKAPNLAPIEIKTAYFTVWLGKSTNLLNLHNKVQFPASFVTQSPDSYAYMYSEYSMNPYGWSSSSPPSKQTVLLTLMIFNGTTLDNIRVKDLTVPIRVFSDKTVMSVGLCMYWNRFASNSSGGAWSSRGVANDANGCLVTHLSDIGVFIDGNLPTTLELHEAATYYKPNPLAHTDLVGALYRAFVGAKAAPTADSTKLSTIVIAGMVVLFNVVLICLGYKHDVKVREHIARGVTPFQTYHFDGDGISGPLNVDDPIAYKWTHLRNPLFVKTFWNVVKRDHILVASRYYHVQFSRPQRLMCALALQCGTMGINAVIYGNPNKIASGEQFIVSGILSALIMFPLYCCLLLLFNLCPTIARKTLIRRTHPTTELCMLEREANRQEKRSTLAPTGGQYPALRSSQPMARSQDTTLLLLPAPLKTDAGNVMRTAPGVLPLSEPPRAPSTAQLALNNIQPPPPKYPPPLALADRLRDGVSTLPPIFFTAKTPARPPIMPLALCNLPPSSGNTAEQPPMSPPPSTPGSRALPPVPNLESIAQSIRPQPPSQLSALPVPGARAAPAPPHSQAVGVSLECAGVGGVPPSPAERKIGAEVEAPPTPSKLFEGERKAPNPDSRRAPLPLPPDAEHVASCLSGSVPSPRTPSLPPPSTRITPKSSEMRSMIFGTFNKYIASREQLPSSTIPPFPPAALPRLPLAPSRFSGGQAPSSNSMTPEALTWVPQPPAPPREDDAAFVRRIRMTYMNRITRDHQKLVLLQQGSLAKPIPTWIYSIMVLIPYVCCLVISAASIFYISIYGLKFDTWQEQQWAYACIVGICMVVFILETIRMSITTIVELRHFEIRKKAKAGDFAARRVKCQSVDDASTPTLLHTERLLPPEKTPFIPKAAPKFSILRPSFLPDIASGETNVAPPRPPLPLSEGNIPILRPPGSRVPPAAPNEPRTPSGSPTQGPPTPSSKATAEPLDSVTHLNLHAPLTFGGRGSHAAPQVSRFSATLHESLHSRMAGPGRGTGSQPPPPPPPPAPTAEPRKQNMRASTGEPARVPKPPSGSPSSTSSIERARMRAAQ